MKGMGTAYCVVGDSCFCCFEYQAEQTTLLKLYSYSFLLSPRQATQLLWSRCINTSGRPGKNVAMDIHMEHLNRTCKDAICGLGANKTPKAITRIGKCIGILTSVTENFGEQTEITKNKAAHTMSSEEEDRDLVIKELLSHAVFTPVPGRTHSSFSNIDSGIFSKLSYGDITTWMTKSHSHIIFILFTLSPFAILYYNTVFSPLHDMTFTIVTAAKFCTHITTHTFASKRWCNIIIQTKPHGDI